MKDFKQWSHPGDISCYSIKSFIDLFIWTLHDLCVSLLCMIYVTELVMCKYVHCFKEYMGIYTCSYCIVFFFVFSKSNNIIEFHKVKSSSGVKE